MNPLLASILSDNCEPDFVTPAELAEARQIEAALDVLTEHLFRFKPGLAKKNMFAARSAYLHNPSEESLAKFEAITLRYTHAELSSHLRTGVKSVVDEFVQTRVVPLGERLMKRATEFFSQHLKEARALEEERALDIAGISLRNSEIVNALQGVLNELSQAAVSLRTVQPYRLTHYLGLLGYSLASDKPSWAE
jgi:hypothetical protein